MKIASSIYLNISNRDGDVYAVKTDGGKCFLVITSDTFRSNEVFAGISSTQQVEISESTFNSLTK